MTTATDLYAGVLLLTVLPTGYLISILWNYRSRPCGRWFILALVGASGWAVFWALMLLFDSYTLSLVCLNFVVVSVTFTFVGMLFVAIEYTWQTRIGFRVAVPFLFVPAVLQLLLWSNPLHRLFWQTGTRVDARGVIIPDHGIAFLIHTGYGYLLVLVSVVLFIIALVNREGLYRKQALLMLLGWLVPILTSFLFVFDIVPTDYLNPTPLGFLAGVGIWGWALFRYQLLKTAPIARRTALREMDEGVIMADKEGIITDANLSAKEILELHRDPTGLGLSTALEKWPALLSTIQQDNVADETVILSKSDQNRYLTVTKTPINQDGGDVGWVIVLKDQTRLIRHEEDLELLKEVLSRVLRHDIRNKLNVIRSHGELFKNRTDGAHAEQAGKIVETSDEIIETAEKARAIEALVDADRQRYDVDLVGIVDGAVQWATERFPEAIIESDMPEEAWVRADDAIDHAVRSLIENGIVHNDVAPPRVALSVEVESNTVRLIVEDNGPGIPDAERQIFYGRSIDQLNHGSGLGLWLVNWVVRNSGAQVDIVADESGTQVTMEFMRASEDLRDSNHEFV